MLHLPQKTHYGMLALLELARRWPGPHVPVAEIASERAIPERFLAGILHDLAAGGIVESVRGSRGGFRLSRAPKEIAAADAVRALTGAATEGRCAANQDTPRCATPDCCPVRELFAEATAAATRVFEGVNLRDLLHREQALSAAGQLDYVI
jgi:Rrf2 family transcriptional regulator, cysteine metabolism repressor